MAALKYNQVSIPTFEGSGGGGQGANRYAGVLAYGRELAESFKESAGKKLDLQYAEEFSNISNSQEGKEFAKKAASGKYSHLYSDNLRNNIQNAGDLGLSREKAAFGFQSAKNAEERAAASEIRAQEQHVLSQKYNNLRLRKLSQSGGGGGSSSGSKEAAAAARNAQRSAVINNGGITLTDPSASTEKEEVVEGSTNPIITEEEVQDVVVNTTEAQSNDNGSNPAGDLFKRLAGIGNKASGGLIGGALDKAKEIAGNTSVESIKESLKSFGKENLNTKITDINQNPEDNFLGFESLSNNQKREIKDVNYQKRLLDDTFPTLSEEEKNSIAAEEAISLDKSVQEFGGRIGLANAAENTKLAQLQQDNNAFSPEAVGSIVNSGEQYGQSVPVVGIDSILNTGIAAFEEEDLGALLGTFNSNVRTLEKGLGIQGVSKLAEAFGSGGTQSGDWTSIDAGDEHDKLFAKTAGMQGAQRNEVLRGAYASTVAEKAGQGFAAVEAALLEESDRTGESMGYLTAQYKKSLLDEEGNPVENSSIVGQVISESLTKKYELSESDQKLVDKATSHFGKLITKDQLVKITQGKMGLTDVQAQGLQEYNTALVSSQEIQEKLEGAKLSGFAGTTQINAISSALGLDSDGEEIGVIRKVANDKTLSQYTDTDILVAAHYIKQKGETLNKKTLTAGLREAKQSADTYRILGVETFAQTMKDTREELTSGYEVDVYQALEDRDLAIAQVAAVGGAEGNGARRKIESEFGETINKITDTYLEEGVRTEDIARVVELAPTWKRDKKTGKYEDLQGNVKAPDKITYDDPFVINEFNKEVAIALGDPNTLVQRWETFSNKYPNVNKFGGLLEYVEKISNDYETEDIATKPEVFRMVKLLNQYGNSPPTEETLQEIEAIKAKEQSQLSARYR